MSGQLEFLEEQAAIEAEIKRAQEAEIERIAKEKEKKENRRFWINTAISAISALGAVAAAIFAAVSIFR